MHKIHNIILAAMTGAAIAVASFLSNIFRIGYIIDPLLIPFCFLFLKQKSKDVKLWWALIVAIIILLPYKYYLTLFLICYWLLAVATIKFGKKITFVNTLIISFIYALTYYYTWYIIARFVHGIDTTTFLVKFTGFKANQKELIYLILIIEPLVYGTALQILYETSRKYKL